MLVNGKLYNMKKMFLMSLATMFAMTVGHAKVNVTETPAQTPDGVEAVDMGLSVKWANMNVGAKKSSGFGTYFAWGETKPKEYYSWNTYAWSRGNTQFLTKYPYMKEQAWKDALGFNPDIVIVKLGTNDSKPKNWKFSKEFAADMQQMVDSLKSLPSHPKIFLASPIKAYSSLGTISDSIIVNEICPIVKKIARRNKCQFIDLHSLYQPTEGMMQSDGIHPTIKGAEYLADIIKQFIISKK